MTVPLLVSMDLLLGVQPLQTACVFKPSCREAQRMLSPLGLSLS